MLVTTGLFNAIYVSIHFWNNLHNQIEDIILYDSYTSYIKSIFLKTNMLIVLVYFCHVRIHIYIVYLWMYVYIYLSIYIYVYLYFFVFALLCNSCWHHLNINRQYLLYPYWYLLLLYKYECDCENKLILFLSSYRSETCKKNRRHAFLIEY